MQRAGESVVTQQAANQTASSAPSSHSRRRWSSHSCGASPRTFDIALGELSSHQHTNTHSLLQSTSRGSVRTDTACAKQEALELDRLEQERLQKERLQAERQERRAAAVS